MTDTTEKKFVLQVGDKFKFKDPYGPEGRGIYLGSNKVFDLVTGKVQLLAPETDVNADDTDTEAKPVIVLNQAPIGLGTIVSGVFFGSLMTAVLMAIFAVLFGAAK